MFWITSMINVSIWVIGEGRGGEKGGQTGKAPLLEAKKIPPIDESEISEIIVDICPENAPHRMRCPHYVCFSWFSALAISHQHHIAASVCV